MPKIFNYYKNYSKYYVNPFFLDFKAVKILKSNKEQKARIYYCTHYKKNVDDKDKDNNLQENSNGAGSNYEVSSEEIKVIFNTIIKKKINDPSNILEELTLDDNNDIQTYKIEFEKNEKADLDISSNFNNFSNNSIISGLVSRISTEEHCKNLLDENIYERFLEKKMSSDKLSNFNLSTHYARENTENEYAKNTESTGANLNLKTVMATTEENEKQTKVNFTLGKYSQSNQISQYSSKFGSEKKKNTTESKLINIKNLKQDKNELVKRLEKTTFATTSKIISQKHVVNLNNNKNKKITFFQQQPIQQVLKEKIGPSELIEKKNSSNVVASVPKKAEENLTSNIITSAKISNQNLHNPDLLKSPNDKINKVIMTPLNLAGITAKQSSISITSRVGKTKINSNRTISKDELFSTSTITKNINLIANKSVDFKKVFTPSTPYSSNKKMNSNYQASINSSNNKLRSSAKINNTFIELENGNGNEIISSTTAKTIVKKPNKKFNSFNSGIFLKLIVFR